MEMMINGMKPSLNALSSSNYAKIKPRQHEGLQELVRHHVDSFNFVVDEGLKYAIQVITL